jgi:hypothetical protein
MAEVLRVFEQPVAHSDGRRFRARVCAAPMSDGTWQGWFEFVAPHGEVIRSQRETTQPARQAVDYWATGLTPVYLEGALARALTPPPPGRILMDEPPAFDGPAPPRAPGETAVAILNPYSVREKGVDLLRRELRALDPWHLRNVIRAYELERGTDDIDRMSRDELVELIVLRTGRSGELGDRGELYREVRRSGGRQKESS